MYALDGVYAGVVNMDGSGCGAVANEECAVRFGGEDFDGAFAGEFDVGVRSVELVGVGESVGGHTTVLDGE